MWLLGYPVRLLRCSYVVANVLKVVVRVLLRYPGCF